MADAAATRIPPPLVYAAFIIIGKLLQDYWPLPELPITLADALMWLALGFSISLLIWSMVTFRRYQTSIGYNLPARSLMTTGPFAYSRNPVYAGFAMLMLALACSYNNLWIVILMIPTCLAVNQLVIKNEEAYLERHFKEAYQAYRKTVRRWF